jgi:hypothetical protein
VTHPRKGRIKIRNVQEKEREEEEEGKICTKEGNSLSFASF